MNDLPNKTAAAFTVYEYSKSQIYVGLSHDASSDSRLLKSYSKDSTQYIQHDDHHFVYAFNKDNDNIETFTIHFTEKSTMLLLNMTIVLFLCLTFIL